MLYTNTQLAMTYTEAWQATQNKEYASVVKETLNYLQREMVSEVRE